MRKTTNQNVGFLQKQLSLRFTRLQLRFENSKIVSFFDFTSIYANISNIKLQNIEDKKK